MSKKFIWLAETGYWGNKHLIKGQSYDTKDFPSHVVDEWEKTKALRFVSEDKPKATPKKDGGQ